MRLPLKRKARFTAFLRWSLTSLAVAWSLNGRAAAPADADAVDEKAVTPDAADQPAEAGDGAAPKSAKNAVNAPPVEAQPTSTDPGDPGEPAKVGDATSAAVAPPPRRPYMLQELAPIDTSYLRIEWPASLLRALEKDKGQLPPQEIAAKACTALGTALVAGKGLWGLGLFADFGCFLPADGKAAATPFAGHKATAKPAWILRLSDNGKTLRFASFYVPPDAGAAPIFVGKGQMATSAWTQDLLRDKGYACLAAALILDSLPAIGRFPPVPEAANGPVDLPVSAGGEAGTQEEKLRPKGLVLFTWARDPVTQLWEPHVVGTASVQGSGADANWHLVFDAVPGDQALFVHNPRGPGKQQGKINKLLNKQQKALLTNDKTPGFEAIRNGAATAARFVLLNTVESGYVGLRVGRELIDPSSAIIPPATVIGILGEVRTGYLAGLRIYYDLEPKHGSTVNNQSLWVEFSRLVVGYNFGLKMPWLVDRLEAAPKIGVWNVNSRLPEYDDSGNIAYQTFILNNALSLGGEGAAVWEGKRYLIRLWYGRDVSVNFVSKAGLDDKVTSQRYGVDAFFKGPPITLFSKPWWLSYLLFAYHEDLTFTQASPHAANFSLEFSSNFAGGGLSLAW